MSLTPGDRLLTVKDESTAGRRADDSELDAGPFARSVFDRTHNADAVSRNLQKPSSLSAHTKSIEAAAETVEHVRCGFAPLEVLRAPSELRCKAPRNA